MQYINRTYRRSGTLWEGVISDLVKSHDEYLNIDGKNNERQENYRGLFNAHFEQLTVNDIRTATNVNYVLGSTYFQEQITEAPGIE